MGNEKIIIFDGHDGSGKTTLAKMLAKYINGRYVKPFEGEVASLMEFYYYNKQFDSLNSLTKEAIQKIYEENTNDDYLIFDRHWVTMFTLLPEKYLSSWEIIPRVFLCWAQPYTTLQRLNARCETKRNNLENHKYYCSLYKKIALEYGLLIIDTTKSTPSKSFNIIKSELKKIKDFSYN